MLTNFKKIVIGILLAAVVFAAGFNTISASAASGLTEQEAADLLFMREEEKLARDVYTALYATWQYPAFQNIAASEQKHMDAVKVLLDTYGLTDPALTPGKFTDPALQALYDQFVAQGSVSLTEALKVGASIEEIDIRGLQTRIAQTDNSDIQWVYNSLLKGSANHLKAFTGQSGAAQNSMNGGTSRSGRGGRW